MLKRIGVGGRLLIAFFGISAFAVLAATAAVYAFLIVGNLLDRITQQRMPAALDTLEIARQSEQIVAAAPSFLGVTTAAQRERLSEEITSEVEYLNHLVARLGSAQTFASSHEVIQTIVTRMQANLTALDLLVANRIIASERKGELLSRLARTIASAQRVLAPGIRVMDAKISQVRSASTDPALSVAERTAALGDLAEAIPGLHLLQKAQVEVSAIDDALLRAASAASPGDLKLLQFPLRRSLDNLARYSGELDHKLQDLIEARVKELRGFIEGAESILDARGTELDFVARGEELLAENVTLSRQLTEASGRLVSAAREDIAAADREAGVAQRVSTAILAVVVALSLISSTLIVWLYVGRNLVGRLTALSDSMLAIAGGNLQAPLPPPRGEDEISRMTEALKVFRDTALEVEAKNLRTIEQAQQRLVDALENTSEGFAFYDAEDRLELCNSRYVDMLYPGMAGRIVPGMTFEAIIRAAAEEGLIASAESRVEDWIAERLARHRDPGEPHLQQRNDGRWILISEHRTAYGGTVAVYGDITDLKQREDELAEKSNALEQLSNQLAKYLSPQVYESIFRGRQEVKIASSRKKLTIFFSDIANFTETADRLESEELSQLLNHYLTEMSRIALDYGATIDKYVGDAILIFFGDPETKGVKEDALACVRMAIAMRSRMEGLADVWRESGIERPLRIRMGIHTGYCAVGNFGSEDRMDYTIVGGAVNTASRLESSAARDEILISYETFAHVREEIFCLEHGEVEVKGIAYPVAAYRVVDSYDNLDRQRQHFHEEHPNLLVDLRLDAMTTDDRDRAARALHRGLELLGLEAPRDTLDLETPEGLEELLQQRHPSNLDGAV